MNLYSLTLEPVVGQLQNMEQVLNAVRTEGKLGCSATASPWPTLLESLKEFVAFLWQIAPIVPVLPTHPANKPFAVNKMPVECHLHTVEVVGSNPAVPTMIISSPVGKSIRYPIHKHREQMQSVLDLLHQKLIVSCQADTGDPLDDLETLSRIATSVLRGGAGGLRAEGVAGVKAYRALTQLPIIGMVKTWDCNRDVYITPTFSAAASVSVAGADIIALDCTKRRLSKPEPWPILIRKIHDELGLPVLADIATVDDAIAAEDAGADSVATTLYGYTAETAGIRSFSWDLLERIIKKVKVPIFAEGHINQPGEAQKALNFGAHAVVIGSAITRPEFITSRFVAAIKR